jgi:hypothetical protein
MVVPDFDPLTVVLPNAELLMTTSASAAPARSASVAPLIVPTIESPAWTFHFVRFKALPVRGSPPVGRSRLPDPLPLGSIPLSDVAGGASTRATSTSTAATSHDASLGRAIAARTSMR